MSRPRRQLRELPQARVGLVGLVSTVALVTIALTATPLQQELLGTQYTAEFAEGGGLRQGDEVRVSGLKVGTVKGVELSGSSVEVTFDARDITIGDRSTAAVKSNNALGAKFLAVDLEGRGSITSIPLERTDPGFRVNEVLGRLTASNAQLDVDQIADSFDSLTAILKETPEEFRSALTGVGQLSESISSRDEELATLLQRSSSISGVLSDRAAQITDIMSDGSLLFAELQARQQVISEMLVNVRDAAAQLRGLADENRTTFAPQLRKLQKATELLNKYDDALTYAVRNLGGYARGLGEGVGSGPFFNASLQNLNGAGGLLPTGGVASIIDDLLTSGTGGG